MILEERLHLQHVVDRDALGDADHQLDLGAGGLHDGVGGERRRHEDHRRVGAGRLAGLGHRVEHRDVLHLVAALARGDAGHHLCPVVAAAEGVERALLAGDALHEQARVVVHPDRHDYAPPFAAATTFSAASAMSLATMNWNAASRRMRRPSSTFVPSRRTTTGIWTSPSSSMAPTTPRAMRSVRAMPPKMLISTALTLGSDTRMRKAFFTASCEAPPPTSRKLAGSPP